MLIVVPTRGRWANQRTLRNLPREIRDEVLLVCPSTEVNNHRGVRVMAQPDDGWTIARKRKWILEELCAQEGEDKVVMLDDDVRFCARREDCPTKFNTAKDEEVVRAFQELEHVLSKEVPHAGFGSRGGSISETDQQGGWQKCKRMMYVLGYHVPTVLSNCELGRIETREDMDLTLQLLRKGFPNALNLSLVVDQFFNNTGGCSGQRTVGASNADALRLAELHPGYVRVVQKEYTSSVPRIEVVCSWKKAYEEGLLQRQLGVQAEG